MKSRPEYEQQAAAAREAGDVAALAHALRHLSELDRRAGDPGSALSHAEEAVRLYRTLSPPPKLDLANALRLAALATADLDGDATGAWREARAHYAEVGVAAGVDECDGRLGQA